MKKYLTVLAIVSMLVFVSCSIDWKTGNSYYGFTLGEQHSDTMTRLQDMAKLGKISNMLDSGFSFVDKRVAFFPLASNIDYQGIKSVGLEFVGSIKKMRSYLVEIDFLLDNTPGSDEKVNSLLKGYNFLSNSVVQNQYYTESNSYYVFTNKALEIEAKHSKISNSQRLIVVYWGCILYIQEYEQ